MTDTKITDSTGNAFTDLGMDDEAKAAEVVCWLNKNWDMDGPSLQVELIQRFASALRQAREDEREACAKIADEWGNGRYRVQEPDRSRFNIYDLQTRVNTTGRGIAEDIRARSAKEG